MDLAAHHSKLFILTSNFFSFKPTLLLWFLFSFLQLPPTPQHGVGVQEYRYHIFSLVQTAPSLHMCGEPPHASPCSSATENFEISVCLAVRVNGLRAAQPGNCTGNQKRSSSPGMQNCPPGLLPSICGYKNLQLSSVLELSRLW